LFLKYSFTFAPSKIIINKLNLKMKKLLSVLMIAGLFAFASCGGGEKPAEDAATAVDSAASAASDAVAGAATDAANAVAAAADTAAAAVSAAADSMTKK
jgi:type IV secretory pathway TrbL component